MKELNTAQKIAKPVLEGLEAIALTQFGGAIVQNFTSLNFSGSVGCVISATAGMAIALKISINQPLF